MTEDEMVGWHHQLNEHEFEQSSGIGDGQESLACCSLGGCKELDTTELLHSLTHSEPLYLLPQVGSWHQVAKVLELQL